jgi:CubicO group peptidase (beta-lactamase class C family)
MKKTFLAWLFLLTVSWCLAAPLPPALPRSTPEKEGISSSAILSFVEALDQQIDTLNSFMLVRHGRVVAEGWWSPYDSQSPHILFSLSKSFTSTAVGLAVAEGKLSLDDEVLKFFPEEAPPNPSLNLKAMRVRDLLCMSTGHQTEPRLGNDQPWTKAFLAHPVPHKPGTHFLYNTPATYMQSAIVQKVTGMTVLEYLRPRLFEPLGFENPAWGTSPQGITLGGYGLSLRTEEIARFGQLCLQKGNWQGRSLVPASWITMATARQTSNGSNPKSDWDQGYGFQFWRCRNNIYRGDGAFGQYCIVMPDQDAVLAITSGVGNMQAVLDLVWEKLLPALGSKGLPADRPASQKLSQKLKSLAVRPVNGSATSPLASSMGGKSFEFPHNDLQINRVRLEMTSAGTTLVFHSGSGESRIECGAAGSWKKGKSLLPAGFVPRLISPAEQPVAASGAWTREDTFTVKLCLTGTPFYLTLDFHCQGEQLILNSEFNVSFGARKLPPLAGQAAKRE